MTKKILIIALLFSPVLLFADSSNQNESFISFLMGKGVFEEWFMQVFTNLDVQIQEMAIHASLLGRAIGGLGALIYLSYLGWTMQEGDAWRVTPMIRPIVIGLILINWTGFVSLIQAPLEIISTPSKDVFFQIEEQVDDKRILKYKKEIQLIDFLFEERSRQLAEDKENEFLQNEGGGNWFVEKMADLFQPIIEYGLRLKFETQEMVGKVMDAIAIIVLRVATYLIFFIQKIWTYILIVLGPIAIGMALIPGFENSFAAWIAKFININLYTFIAYTIINIGQQLILAGYDMQIERYDTMLSGEGDVALIMQFVTGGGFIYIRMFSTVAYLVTAIGILMTPTIADAIVSAGGAGLASKTKSATGKVYAGAKAAAVTAKTGGAAAVVAAASAVNSMRKK
jgi:hypothetical protein